jgi:uncharacterized FlgJ-related protein
MKTRTYLNEITKNLYNKRFKDLNKSELQKLATKFNI